MLLLSFLSRVTLLSRETNYLKGTIFSGMLFFDDIMLFIPTFREEIMLRKIFLPYFDRHNYNFTGLS